MGYYGNLGLFSDGPGVSILKQWFESEMENIFKSFS